MLPLILVPVLSLYIALELEKFKMYKLKQAHVLIPGIC